MKIDRLAQKLTASTTQPFRRLLQEAKASQPAVSLKPGPARPVPPGLTARPALALVGATEVLTTARVHAEQESRRLTTRRAEAVALGEGEVSSRAERAEALASRTEDRLLELITRELAGGQPTPAPAPAAQPAEAPARTRAAQAAALIEQIERFVRSQRPGLALTLNNSLGARVEVERIGPREVAVRLVGHRGPPAPEAVSRVRDALRERGLKVGALSVA